MKLQSPRSTDFETALLVGFYRRSRERDEKEHSLTELSELAASAGALVWDSLLFELKEFHPATLIGSGKIEEIRQRVGINLVIFDEDLSPAQNRNLENLLQKKVIDRTALILDIFARRAHSREGKIQVELAQLKYLLPRLIGRGREFSQLAGGIGTRGPGETKLEMDRRKVRIKIGCLTKELKKVRAHRLLHRQKREALPIATVSLIGYTNAGKSTLMNRLTGAGVDVADKLFVTLDPTVRRLKLPSGREILLADTVGFVRKLPHQLIDAFRATFEEVAASDLLLHLVDVTHPQAADTLKVVNQVLEELGLEKHPLLRVFNKLDQNGGAVPEAGDLFISALRGDGIDHLLEAIDRKLAASFHCISLLIPHSAGGALSLLYETSRVLKREDRREGVFVQAEVEEKYFNKFRKFHIEKG